MSKFMTGQNVACLNMMQPVFVIGYRYLVWRTSYKLLRLCTIESGPSVSEVPKETISRGHFINVKPCNEDLQ